jgi:hypothetical protein
MPGLVGRRAVIVVAAAVALAAVAGAAAGLTLTAPSPSHSASLGLDGRTSATLKIVTGTPVLDVSVARLTGTLLRVSTPSGAPVRPVLAGPAPVVLSLVHAPGRDASYPVMVVLSSAVTWRIDFAAGTRRTEADLRGGKVGEIMVTAGSDVLDVSLPRPAGTLPFLLAGGVSQFVLSLPGGVPAQVRVGGGASYVSVDGQSRTGIAGGTLLTPPGWTTAVSRIDIDATAGFSRLTVSRWWGSG